MTIKQGNKPQKDTWFHFTRTLPPCFQSKPTFQPALDSSFLLLSPLPTEAANKNRSRRSVHQHNRRFCCTELVLKRPQTFEKFSEFLSERLPPWWIPKPQFWYPPLWFGSQLQIPEPLFSWFSRYTLLIWFFSAVSAPSAYKKPTVTTTTRFDPWCSMSQIACHNVLHS